MKTHCKPIALWFVLLSAAISGCGQKVFSSKQLPLAPDRSGSLETRLLSKPVSDRLSIDFREGRLSSGGSASLAFSDSSFTLSYPSQPSPRPVGPPDDIDYGTYGQAWASLDLGGADLEGYNRIFMRIRPLNPGQKVNDLELSFTNSDQGPKEGYTNPTGSHLIILKNMEWNDCVLEIAAFRRDKAASLGLSFGLRGKDKTGPDTLRFEFKDLRFEKVDEAEKTIGWEPMDGRIIRSSSGYLPGFRKTAIISGESAAETDSFELVDKKGRTVFSGKVKRDSTSIGEYGVLDFSGFDKEGDYLIRAGKAEAGPVRLSSRLWDEADFKILSYIYGQRCGQEVKGVHSDCHHDLFADFGGRSYSYAGGWHDAGDLSQQTLQTAETALDLLEAGKSLKNKNRRLAESLIEEARWGLDFVMRCHLPDGNQASSMGLLHWTDNEVGTADDIHTVRVQNLAFDRFVFAGVEAYAAACFEGGYADSLSSYAKKDFDYAMERFIKEGFEPFRFIMEHSWNTSESQYEATISWSASQLYRLTGEEKYARAAAAAAGYFLDCQQKTTLADGTAGFFYRNKEKKSIVHFIHQSRSQIFALALAELLATQPESRWAPEWKAAMERLGCYIKGLLKYTAPYGMIPSGVWELNEWKDSAAFNSVHIFAPSDYPERYVSQLRKGVQIDSTHFVRRFPVWFTIFNGNNAILLSSGKSAAVAGKVLGDKELLQAGLEQLYWVVGKNPFGQSLIYGEGRDYPEMNSFSSGTLTGEIPVGIRTIGDEDIPFWPSINNACYKEVWVTSAGKWLSLASEYTE